MEFAALAQQCASSVHPTTMRAVVRVESQLNPYAIGVNGGRQLVRMPANKAEAVATAKSLEEQGFDFDVGLAQINRRNLAKFGVSYEAAFEPCENLRVGASILTDCYQRASVRFNGEQQALQAAFSCYNTGRFDRGFVPRSAGQLSYVDKVLNAAAPGARAKPAQRPVSTPRRETREALQSDDTVLVFR